MNVRPIDYLNDEYLKPLNIKQKDLCNYLNLGSKTINELFTYKRDFTINTAIRFGKFLNIEPKVILDMQTEYNLQNEKVDTNDVKPYHLDKNYELLLNSLNRNSNYNYKLKDLYDLFHTNKYDNYKNLVFTVVERVDFALLVKYMLLQNLGLNKLKSMYNYYLKRLNGVKQKDFELFVVDTESQVLDKVLHRKKYKELSEPRTFERYLYLRLSFFKNKNLFKLNYEKTNDLEEKQKYLYLYNYLTHKDFTELENTKPVSLRGMRVKPYLRPDNKYGVVDGIDRNRFNQFINTGTF